MPSVGPKKAINELTSGHVVEIRATDKSAKSDLTAWAGSGGNELLELKEDGDVLKFWIKKG